MSLNNKLDLRLEAAKIVCQLPETTIENFHERAYRVELYLAGDAELPEQDGAFEELKNMIQEAKEMLSKPAGSMSATEAFELVPGYCLGLRDPGLTGYYQKHPYVAPRSDADSSVFLQQDGEKVE